MSSFVRSRFIVTLSLTMLALMPLVSQAHTPAGGHSGFQHPHANQDELTHIQSVSINANPTLWDLGANGAGIIILSIDTGAKGSHRDLTSKTSCKVDLHTTNDCSDGGIPPVGHGTAIAAIMAAVGTIGTGNGQGNDDGEDGGMIGVAPLSHVDLIKLRLDSTDRQPGKASFADDLNGLQNSAWNTAHIVTISTNEEYSTGAPGDETRVANICSKINDFLDADKIVVLSAGNDNRELTEYGGGFLTASYPPFCEIKHPNMSNNDDKLIVVGATNGSFSARKSDSNFGAIIDIYAPGEEIWAANASSVNAYSSFGGTSFAAPMVAGAAAQLLSCGVSANSVKRYMQMGSRFTPIQQPQPPGGSKPSLDVKGALEYAHDLGAVSATYTLKVYHEGTNTQIEDSVVTDTGALFDLDTETNLTTSGGTPCNQFTYQSSNAADFSIDGSELEFTGSASTTTMVTSIDYFGNTATGTINIVVEVPPVVRPRPPDNFTLQ